MVTDQYTETEVLKQALGKSHRPIQLLIAVVTNLYRLALHHILTHQIAVAFSIRMLACGRAAG
jgi:hypothetical protein